MWQGKSLAVVLPTYNEAASIRACIEAFEWTGIVDDIVVVNNNAHPATGPEVEKTSARQVHEPRQGYGAAIRRGLAETRDFDLVCLCEPDGTFDPSDLLKLLPFLSDAEVVFGSRTVQTFLFDGANMGPFIRWGNWFVAKLIEVLFNTTYLSDVGCTFRVMTRSSVDAVEPALRGDQSALGLEHQLAVVVRRLRFVQVPVRYLPRVGESAVTGRLSKTIPLGFEMIRIVLRERARTIGTRPARGRSSPAVQNTNVQTSDGTTTFAHDFEVPAPPMTTTSARTTPASTTPPATSTTPTGRPTSTSTGSGSVSTGSSTSEHHCHPRDEPTSRSW